MRPFIMWAGGKTKLMRKYNQSWFVGDFEHYIEPFLGGGAVFAYLHDREVLPEHVLLSDGSEELIGVYQAIQSDLGSFLTDVDVLLDEYLALPSKERRKEWYYGLRKRYWQSPNASTLFILMRTGFNGIWQSCKEANGLFATPAGLLNHTRREQIYSKENLEEWHKVLRDVELKACDYHEVSVPPRSLLYLDPPYRGSFTTYGTGFGDEDQLELIAWARKSVEGGGRALFANRDVEGDPFFQDAFGNDAEFQHFDVTYTAGRRKKVDDGYEAKKAKEFLAKIGA